MGRLIPAGTGAFISSVRRLAAGRDKVALAARQQSDAIEHAVPDVDDVAKAAANG